MWREPDLSRRLVLPCPHHDTWPSGYCYPLSFLSLIHVHTAPFLVKNVAVLHPVYAPYLYYVISDVSDALGLLCS